MVSILFFSLGAIFSLLWYNLELVLVAVRRCDIFGVVDGNQFVLTRISVSQSSGSFGEKMANGGPLDSDYAAAVRILHQIWPRGVCLLRRNPRLALFLRILMLLKLPLVHQALEKKD